MIVVRWEHAVEIVKPTLGRLVLLWWSILWRCLAYGLGGAVIVGVTLGVILGVIGASTETMTLVGEFVGVAIGVVACAYVGWSRVGKQIGAYRLVLVKSVSTEID